MREAVAVFDDLQTLDTAVYELETLGFDRASFSLLASEDAVEKKLGHRYQQVKEMEDNPKTPRATFFSHISRLEAEYLPAPIFASIGALTFAGIASALPALIAAGSGAVLGIALGRLMHERHATRIREQVARGGLLLWVSVRNAQEEKTALNVLRAHSTHDVHSHEIAA